MTGFAGMPLYADPVAYARSQRRMVEEVRPRRPHLGHRSRALANPKAEALKPAAEALGLPTQDPAAWPPAFFMTLHGHLAPAAAPA